MVSFARDAIRLVAMMVLARLLLPEDYGHFAMATAVTGWLTGVGFLNFSPNLLREAPRPAEVATYLRFGLLWHGLLTVVGFGIAGALWFGLDRPVVAALVALGTCALAPQVPAEIERQLLQREFRWAAVRLWEVGTALLASVAAILLAWRGFGPFALLAAMLIEPIPFAVLLLMKRTWRPLRSDPAIREGVRRFGWPMVVAHALWSGSHLLSTWAVGTLLGATVLGLFNRGVAVTTLVVGRISGQAAYAVMPVLAKVHTDPHRRRIAGRLLLRAAVWSQCVLAGAFVFVAEPAIGIVYGERWLALMPLLPPMIALSLVASLVVVLEPMVLASGRSDRRMLWEIVRFAGTAACIPILWVGLEWYVYGLTALHVVLLVFAVGFAAREGWLSRADVHDAFVPAIVAGGGALLATNAVGYAYDGAARQFVEALLFAGVYLLLLAACFPSLTQELLLRLPRGQQVVATIWRQGGQKVTPPPVS